MLSLKENRKKKNMKRIFSFLCAVLLVCSVQAQPLRGIHVRSGHHEVVVYLNGCQVSMPAESCFIANLDRGVYRVDVRDRSGRVVYHQNVRYPGHGVFEIQVGVSHDGGMYPGTDCFPGGNRYPSHRVMPHERFKDLLDDIEDDGFDDRRLKRVKKALKHYSLTCSQCEDLMEEWSFDGHRVDLLKMVYPHVVDPENFDEVIEELDFISNQNEVKDYLRNYGRFM